MIRANHMINKEEAQNLAAIYLFKARGKKYSILEALIGLGYAILANSLTDIKVMDIKDYFEVIDESR